VPTNVPTSRSFAGLAARMRLLAVREEGLGGCCRGEAEAARGAEEPALTVLTVALR
jgi:hypothetical protein